MKINIRRVKDDTEWVEGVNCPPFSTGLCMACDKQTHGYFGGKTKAGLWVCHACKIADEKAVKK
jgi:hypothetical protein